MKELNTEYKIPKDKQDTVDLSKYNSELDRILNETQKLANEVHFSATNHSAVQQNLNALKREGGGR